MKKEIEYIEPFKSAWDRMVGILFRPFDARKWFVLGFIVWVACLGDGGGGGGSADVPMGGGKHSSGSGSHSADLVGKFKHIPDQLSNMTPENIKIAVIILILVAVVTVLIIAIGFVLTWLKARFGFIFLDDILRDDTLIVEPWKRFKELGDSSFLWMVFLGFISFFAIIATICVGVLLSILCFIGRAHVPLGIVVIVMFLLLLFSEFLVWGLASFFYKHFVIQIMYNENIKVLAAWKVFLRILKNNIFPFFVYSMIVMGSSIALATAALLAGLLTCCIGFLLLAIPYLGTVILLPTFVFFRLYSIEFFKQFIEIPATLESA